MTQENDIDYISTGYGNEFHSPGAAFKAHEALHYYTPSEKRIVKGIPFFSRQRMIEPKVNTIVFLHLQSKDTYKSLSNQA